jgi:hypothetical protein
VDERSAPAMTIGSSWKAEVPNRDAAVAPPSRLSATHPI